MKPARATPALLLTLALPALGLLVFFAQVWRLWPYVNDDAYITFRYSLSLAEGRGPYYNLGERVEGYTNPLWMLLLAGLLPLLGSAALPAAAKALGALTQGAALVLGALLARRASGMAGEGSALLGLAAIGLAASAPGLALNSVSGLETGLYSLLVTAGALAAAAEARDERFRGASLTLAAAGLTRPEGMVVAAVAWACRALLGLPALPDPARRGPLLRALGRDALVLGVVFGGSFALRAALYDGEFLPNTYYAKQGGFEGIPPLIYIWGALSGPMLGVPGLLLAGLGLASRLRSQPTLALPLSVGLAGALLPFATGADWMLGGRLVVPYLPLLAGCAVLGWSALLSRRLPARTAALLTLLALPLAAWLQAEEGERQHAEITLRARGYATGHEALAAWLHERARPGETVGLMDIGVVGYRNPGLRVLDLSGLTDRFIGKSPGEFLDKQYDLSYVLDQDPRFLVLVLYAEGEPYQKPPPGTPIRPWTSMEERLLADSRFQERYRASSVERTGAWTDGVAAHQGAVRVFEHGHPGLNYLLVVFERAGDPAAIREAR